MQKLKAPPTRYRRRDMDLLERIKRPVVEGVQLGLPSGQKMEGMLCTTAFHLIFSTRRKNEEEVTVRRYVAFLSIKLIHEFVHTAGVAYGTAVSGKASSFYWHNVERGAKGFASFHA